jgi:hypothetical protein
MKRCVLPAAGPAVSGVGALLSLVAAVASNATRLVTSALLLSL